MQTWLHGRDLIGDLDFTKEEVETVLYSLPLSPPHTMSRTVRVYLTQAITIAGARQ